MTLTKRTKLILGAVGLVAVALAVLPLFSICRGSGRFDMPLRVRQEGVPIPPTEVMAVGYVFVANPDAAEDILANLAAEPGVRWCNEQATYRDGAYIILVPTGWVGPALGPFAWRQRYQAPYVLLDVRLRDGRTFRAVVRTTERGGKDRMAPPAILDLGGEGEPQPRTMRTGDPPSLGTNGA